MSTSPAGCAARADAGVSRAVQVDVPRPPGSIPRAGGCRARRACRTRRCRVRRAPVPALCGAGGAALDRPLPPPTAFAAPAAPITPFEAFRSGARALKDGQKEKALVSLEYAAEQGVVAAQWKLGRMYAEGDGVEQSDLRAFEYFSRIADGHADDNPGAPQARYVANAFVSLGHYYREGIAGYRRAGRSRPRAPHVRLCGVLLRRSRRAVSSGAADARRQRAVQAIRGRRRAGCNSAANKGQYQAQAVLGRMLFKGETACRASRRAG